MKLTIAHCIDGGGKKLTTAHRICGSKKFTIGHCIGGGKKLTTGHRICGSKKLLNVCVWEGGTTKSHCASGLGWPPSGVYTEATLDDKTIQSLYLLFHQA